MARAIELGYANSTSMGCRCGSSICSICGNKAITEDDFCEHVKNYKGSTFNGLPVFEDNRDIEFFENSIVCEPADPEAKILIVLSIWEIVLLLEMDINCIMVWIC